MDDWQENLYDLSEGKDEEEDFDIDEFGKSAEDDPEEYAYEDPGDLDFKPDFKQLQQLSFGRPGADIPGFKQNIQKAMRSPEEAAVEQAYGILNSGPYIILNEHQIEVVIKKVQKVKNLHLMNMEILVAAIVWKNVGLGGSQPGKLDKKNLGLFSSKVAPTVGPIDLLRYIRMLEV